MTIEVPVRRISVKHATDDILGKGFILEYIVEDAFTIHANLLTDQDPTMVATDYLTISSTTITRDGKIDEATGDVIKGSIESHTDFAARAYLESLEWALDEIVKQNLTNKLVEALESILPPAIDK